MKAFKHSLFLLGLAAFVAPPAHSQTLIPTQARDFSYAVAETPGGGPLNFYKVDTNGAATLVEANIFPDGGPNTFTASDYSIDNVGGKIYFREPPRGGGAPLRVRVFDIKTQKMTGWQELTGFAAGAQPIFVGMPEMSEDKIKKVCSTNDGSTCVVDSESVSLGGDDNIASVSKTGLKVGGKSIVRREINAQGEEELHIGENSLVTVESNGVQKLYATDAAGKKIPINITEGSDLQINGISVQGQIDTNAVNIRNNASSIEKNSKAIGEIKDDVKSLGSGVAGTAALSAALSALPTASEDAPFSCGVGTGGYSSRYAMGVGCAARLNERLSFNAGGSVLFGGASDYGSGTLDTVAGRAGFVFKFGNLTASSVEESKEQLQSKLMDVENRNAELAYQLESLQQRLSQLEALASGIKNPKGLSASVIP
jgi:hypothetical protein